jgi:DNA-binding transcriptional MerR regulator
MTIGTLARRTGVPVKALREYEGAGLIYTVGRSAGNYRLFDDTALCCVDMIGTLRGLGLTLAEIRGLAGVFLGQPGEPVGPPMAELLRVARARTEAQIAELHRRRGRIDKFEARYATQLAGDFQRAQT